jgi:hypothetical protein
MDTIIGLGKAGCNIARKFEKYSQYEIFKLDTSFFDENNYYRLEKHQKPEDYEANCPDLTYFFKYARGNTLFITSGASSVSLATLNILSQLKDKCKLSVLYVKPNMGALVGQSKLIERSVYFILQEFARSGALESLYVVENEKIEKLLGGLPVIGYYDRINDTIVSIIHMINVFDNTESVINTFSDMHETSRIATFGIINPQTGEENSLFDLDNVREKRYYYAVPEEKLKTDNQLLSKVREQVGNEQGTSYGIYSTKYQVEYIYSVSRSSQVQKNKKSKKST